MISIPCDPKNLRLGLQKPTKRSHTAINNSLNIHPYILEGNCVTSLHLSPLGNEQLCVQPLAWMVPAAGSGMHSGGWSFEIRDCRTWVFSLYLAPALATHTACLAATGNGRKSRNIDRA